MKLAPDVRWETGGSIAYRETDGLPAPELLGDEEEFSGKDFRWGLETRLSAANWELQGEYIQADLDGRLATGYYVFAGRDLGTRDQVVASVERLELPRPESTGDPWYILGFNHFFSQHTSKVMVDVRVQFTKESSIYLATIQYQLFFR